MRFRKKPIVIEARVNRGQTTASWCNGQLCKDGRILVSTLEGTMTASKGDWIIKGINGEFYPCKPDIFAKTYDEVEE